MKKIQKIALTLMFAAGISACSSGYLDTVPTSSTSTITIFETTENAKLAVNGIAKLMVEQYLSNQVLCGEGSIKFLWGEYTGENFSRPRLTGWSSTMNAMWHESNTSTYDAYPWYYYYMLIGNANTIIANIDAAAGTQEDKDFIKAQALTYRAFCYEQLVQFYCYRWADSNNGTSMTKLRDGLILRTEANMNDGNLPLVSSGEIYTQIYKDLDDAISLYISSGISRSNVWEPNVNVAYAVYARAAITRQDYNTAKTMAQKARAGYPLMTNAEYKSGFSEPNQEWIWGSYGGGDQTLYYYGFHSYMAYDANTSIVRSYPVSMSKTLYDKIPATDIRHDLFLDPTGYTYSSTTGDVETALATIVRTNHPTMISSHRVTAYHSFKFSINGSIGVGYINHFRSSEMYLIEAEAEYFNGNATAAQGLMENLIKDSGRDPSYTCTATGAALLDEIKFYRAVELWGEGFDWLDKKRYNDPIVRKSFADGGNFASAMAVDRAVDVRNRWTYVTPNIETQYNHYFD